VTRLEQFPNLLVIVKSMSLGDPPQNPFNSIDPRRTWGRWRANTAPRFRTIQFCPKDVGSACSHSPTRLRAAAFD
jgi:hypothetical protein